MYCNCVICEKVTAANKIRSLSDFGAIYYNLTSIEVTNSKKDSLLKICNTCEKKLLQFDSFRTLCIKAYSKLKQNACEILAASPPVVKLQNTHCQNEKQELPVETTTKANYNSCETVPTGISTFIEEIEPVDEDRKEWTQETSGDKEQAQPLRPRLDCRLCGQKFRSQHRLDGHLRVHQGLKPAACKLCDKEFMKWHNYEKHMLHQHTDVRRTMFPCDFEGCDRSYATKLGMMRHRQKHDPEYNRPSLQIRCVCESCGKIFSTRGALKKHSFIHTGKMPFHCAVCDKGVSSAYKLKVHTMRHQGIKNHVCPHCGLKKTTMQELKVHVNYHTKEKTYPCKICTHVFSNTGNLARHIKIVHYGSKPFKCTRCDQSFGKAETLKHHIMRHTGERPHKCAVCGKGFIQLVALRQHSSIHTKKEDECLKSSRTRNTKQKVGKECRTILNKAKSFL